MARGKADGDVGTADPGARYSLAAMALHWIVAALILAQFAIALTMNALPDDSPAQDAVEAVHISVGLTILLFTLARVGLRLVVRPPPLPPTLPPWERRLAQASHALFYILILALPFTGWALKSFFPNPIVFWGLPIWPQLPLFGQLPQAQGMALYGQLETLHGLIMGWALALLLALHVGAVLKHQLAGAPVLWRMLPGRARG